MTQAVLWHQGVHGNEAGPDSEAQFVTCLGRADLRGMSVG